jgi:hypothetical protein
MRKNNSGSALIVVLSFFGVLLLTAALLFGSYISAFNSGVRYEADIEKFHKSSQNTLSSYTLKVQEMAQVPDMYKNDLKDVIEATFQGRYGKDGSKAVMQWIQESNLQFDSKLYLNLQAVMESGRDEFKLSQDRKLEICTQYEKELGFFWKGMMMSFAGYPKKDLDVICKVVLDKQTNATFESGEATVIKIK